MKRDFIFVRFIAVALSILQGYSTLSAQEKSNLSGNQDTSRASFTGAGAGGSSTAVKSRRQRMAWETPYSEGSAIRSTGYTPAMWWKSIL